MGQATPVLSASGLVGRAIGASLIVACVVVVGACGGDHEQSAPALVQVQITPANPAIAKGLTQPFKATGIYSDSSAVELTDGMRWSSDTPAVATIDANSGVATSLATGSTLITGTYSTDAAQLSGTTILTISPAVLQSIAITPAAPFSGVGMALQLTATGTFSDATLADVTSLATWTSSNPLVASIVSTSGLTTGVALGTTTVSATLGATASTAPLSIVSGVWVSSGQSQFSYGGHTATLLPSGQVVFLGGLGQYIDAPVEDQFYEPLADRWLFTGNSRYLRAHTATLLPSGKILVAGGNTGRFETSWAFLCDPISRTETPTAPMLTGRANHAAVLLPDGRVLVVGGYSVRELAPLEAEIYDPATGGWSSAGSMSRRRLAPTATLLPNGKVLVIGGNAELFDPGTGTWSSAPGMTSEREEAHTATRLPSGKVLVAGGYFAGAVLASAELYDPVSGTWTATASMSAPRVGHAATLLNDGNVLVTGGCVAYECAAGSRTASAEIYDDHLGVWSPVADLLTARAYHSATALRNGKVLVRGGGLQESRAELYW